MSAANDERLTTLPVDTTSAQDAALVCRDAVAAE